MKSIEDIIQHYTKEDKHMRDIDNDELEENRQHRFNQRLQRRLATCGDREYPQYLAQQDIFDRYQCSACFKGHEFCGCGEDVLEGIVDISEGEE